MGWPSIYSICFSQFDSDKDSLLLDGGFSFHIVVRLIRDNWKVVIRNYPIFLIGEIWFDLRDKQLLGIILLPLLVRFCLIYRIWAFVLSLYLRDVIKDLLLVLGPFLILFWVYVLSLLTYYFKPHQKLFSFQKKSKKQHDLSLSRNMWKKETPKRIRLSIDLFLGNFFVMFELFQ